MNNQHGPLLNTVQLNARIADGNCVVIDARGGPDAEARYAAGHLKGALFVDLETELSAKSDDAAHGGRHPLPAPNQFGKVLQKLGITPTSVVIVYDDKYGAMAAARFWWMLKAVGHSHVYVLDGGYAQAVKQGFPTATGMEIRIPAVDSYPVADWLSQTVSLQEVEEVSLTQSSVIVDVREAYRYRGEGEPIDRIAGHIPGAINIPYVNNLNDDGYFKSSEELTELYNNVLHDHAEQKIIIHCGSGVTACHTLLAMEHAGMTNTCLYVGSWSEWSRNDKPIATGTSQ
jgi:thiosulfate/3-mercaptopyruvate sulfurtransferase